MFPVFQVFPELMKFPAFQNHFAFLWKTNVFKGKDGRGGSEEEYLSEMGKLETGFASEQIFPDKISPILLNIVT